LSGIQAEANPAPPQLNSVITGKGPHPILPAGGKVAMEAKVGFVLMQAEARLNIQAIYRHVRLSPGVPRNNHCAI